MADRVITSGRAAVAATAVVVAILAGACGDVAPTPVPVPSGVASPGASDAATPGPSSTGTGTPAPAAVDASAAFVTTVTSPAFAAAIDVAGRTVVGATIYTVTGTMEVDGPDSHLVLTTAAGRKSSTVATLVVDGERYTMSKPPGMWFEAPGTGAADLGSALVSVSSVTDTGVESRNGLELHHLVIVPPETLGAALGVNRATYTSVTSSMEAWVEDDGTPVIVEVRASWTQPAGGKSVGVSKALDLAFSEPPGITLIATPETVWQWNISARFKYRLAYPTDWTFKAGTAKYADAYYGFDDNAVFASRGKNQGLSLRELSGGISRYLPQITGIKSPRITSKASAKLGSLPARRIEYTYKTGAVRYYSIMYLAVKGSFYYVMEYETKRKTTKADRAMAAQFASSFSAR